MEARFRVGFYLKGAPVYPGHALQLTILVLVSQLIIKSGLLRRQLKTKGRLLSFILIMPLGRVPSGIDAG